MSACAPTRATSGRVKARRAGWCVRTSSRCRANPRGQGGSGAVAVALTLSALQLTTLADKAPKGGFRGGRTSSWAHVLCCVGQVVKATVPRLVFTKRSSKIPKYSGMKSPRRTSAEQAPCEQTQKNAVQKKMNEPSQRFSASGGGGAKLRVLGSSSPAFWSRCAPKIMN